MYEFGNDMTPADVVAEDADIVGLEWKNGFGVVFLLDYAEEESRETPWKTNSEEPGNYGWAFTRMANV